MQLDMNKYDALTKRDIIDILDTLKTTHNIDMILTEINELAIDKYNLGFNDGYDVGGIDGWSECYDQMSDED